MSVYLVTQSVTLQNSADTIAQGALATLREASTDLEQQLRATEQAAVVALLAALAVTLLMGVRLSRKLTQPLNDLAVATQRINQGDYAHAVAKNEGGEIGLLIAAFNQMTATLLRQHTRGEQQKIAMAQRNCELEQALAQLQRSTTERESLVSMVRALSVPVIPILDQVIVVPLVGELDLERAQVLLERLLHGVTTQRARLAILDITGVPVIDAAAANWLLQTARAVELLGARTILAGTSPEVAQALVASGADLGRVHATVDLRAAVEYALRPLARKR